jgi:adenine-specific DNA-methyltransferase
MAKKRTPQGSKAVPVESIRHKDKRKNIPTEELRDFVAEDENAPKTMLYPRDPSLDPQLVWKGKDEQDQKDLAVPVVPIYIQEKIHPQAIINALPRKEQSDKQLDLFADFNGLPEEFDQRVDFYQHEGNWSNRMILGDSLLVMTSLAEKEGLKGKVQTIYIDPPYGIKFGSNWQVSTRKRDVKDGKAEDATRQPEQVRAFRDTWKLGIHSYLAYLRDRLVVARELLTETGSTFVQIGNENIHLVHCLLDEVFGSENFVSLIPFVTTGSQTTVGPAPVTDFLLWYAKSKEIMKYRPLLLEQQRRSLAPTISWYVEIEGELRPLARHEIANPASLPPKSNLLWLADLLSRSGGPSAQFTVKFDGRSFVPTRGGWRTGEEGFKKLIAAGRLFVKGNTLLFKRYLDDYPYTPLNALWLDTQMGGFAAKDKIYVVQTNASVIERCLLMTTDPGDLILDPTCGSGTTAYVAEQWGRRWITIDTSRVALALARTRLMAAKYPYYLLADSPEGIKKEAELTAKVPPPHKTEGDIRKGFVYKRVPHVTLKSIANNPDIKEGMTREQIDAAITRHAEPERLYDDPFPDPKTVRVSGPFTVESLSPHRTISAEEKKQLSEGGKDGWKMKIIGPDAFATMIMENLQKAGVQNTVKGERLKFDSLDPFAGEWIHAEGRYSEKDGTGKRAAVCIGPEHGTVGTSLIKEAAKEAVKGVGFDILLVCGFAFDPSVNEEAKRYGKLTVLPVRMNPDLSMGEDLLKKTGAGNLFMVFGEPDVEITKGKDGTITVEIKGVDVYDPTTGAIRSSSTDDIACWFIDTSYNDESFFVRHAYFTGAEEPYEKLKRALRAEIDEAAWSELYSTTSRPFDPPESGRIAVKVINHYGDEVLKVYELKSKK